MSFLILFKIFIDSIKTKFIKHTVKINETQVNSYVFKDYTVEKKANCFSECRKERNCSYAFFEPESKECKLFDPTFISYILSKLPQLDLLPTKIIYERIRFIKSIIYEFISC